MCVGVEAADASTIGHAPDGAPIAQMMHVLPIGWVEPEDIGNAIIFLSSDEGRYITGVTLPVDSGARFRRGPRRRGGATRLCLCGLRRGT
jgi:NAD(P)-dependent dehydrogenase (short-subunit alcohol dehydrogenase family)